jgi:GT2 family glycosyltransferase
MDRIQEGCAAEVRETFPLVDIYIPSREKDELYRKAEESIKKNTRVPFNFIEIIGQRSITGNRNAGLKAAKTEFVASLDSDCEIHQNDWLEKLMETMLSADDIGLVGCKIVMYDGKIFSAGTAPNWRPYLYGVEDKGQREIVEEVVGVSANCLLYRSGITLYDECFTGGNGLEDSDFCIRLRKKGYRVMYDGRVKVVHKRYPKDKSPFFWNHLYFHLKHPTTIFTQYRKV